MIPAEVIGLYLVGSGIIPRGQPIVLVVWGAFCLLCVVIIRTYGTADPANNQSAQSAAVFISSVAFVIWVYSLGGPFEAFHLHVPYIGSLAILGWTFVVPMVYKGSA